LRGSYKFVPRTSPRGGPYMTEQNRPTFAPPVQQDDQTPEDGEYVFRFRLQAEEPNVDSYDDPLLELVRGQLEDILRAVVLTCNGRRVQVDGFRLLRDLETQYHLFPSKSTGEAAKELT
jgi:hypothetical protein